MANYHYIITSKSRFKEKMASDGTKTIIIGNVIEIEENNRLRFAPYSIKKGKSDKLFNTLLATAVLGLFFMIIVVIVGKDIFNLPGNLYNLPSDFVAAAGLLMTILSFSKQRELISGFFYYGKEGNKLFIAFYALILPLFIAAVLNYIGVSNEFSNLISIGCVLASLINLK